MKQLTVALIGNPNCGKSTVFNVLTGSQQHIGNWPGVTVERKSGFFTERGCHVEIVDLPGIYSLTSLSPEQALDTQVARDYLLLNRPDMLINVVDAANLSRHLYLTTQLLELNIPVIIALNMMDIAEKQAITIDIEALSSQLGCPVIPMQSRKKRGLAELRQAIIAPQAVNSTFSLYPQQIQTAIDQLASKLLVKHDAIDAHYLAARLLEGDGQAQAWVSSELLAQAAQAQQKLMVEYEEELDIVFADLRYQLIQQVINKAVHKLSEISPRLSSTLDNVVLNRFLGIPIFLAVMYAMFFFAINVGGAFQDFFDGAGNTLFVDGLSYLLTQWHWPAWVVALLAGGLGKGINTTLTFIPVIGAMFLFLALLEASGYMARAAFVMDRFMRALGLPGKSFVPMIIGFGCNVPAVMAARTLENQRDRILTVLMTPFMSCGARMAIYAIFTAAFFPNHGHYVVFALYILGIGMAIFTGFLLRNTLLRGTIAPLVLELPPYHLPTPHVILRQAWQRLKSFIIKAGMLIVPFCMLLGTLNSITLTGSVTLTEGGSESLLAIIGQWLTPLFTPLGVQVDNWPATVGLLTGILAKEVVIGSLNTLYSQTGHLSAMAAQNFDVWGGLREALLSIPANLSGLAHAISNPLLANIPAQTVQQGVYGEMAHRFGSAVNAFAYLIFVLLYLPCVSTIAVIARELNKSWALFATFWSTLLAYGAAVIFYQAASFQEHPAASLSWIMGMSALIGGVIIGLRYYSRTKLQTAITQGAL